LISGLGLGLGLETSGLGLGLETAGLVNIPGCSGLLFDSQKSHPAVILILIY